MAKKPAKKSAPKKVAVKKSAKKAAKKASKKKSAKHQLIMTFEKEKDGVAVNIKGINISTEMMAMGFEALKEALLKEMTGLKTK